MATFFTCVFRVEFPGDGGYSDSIKVEIGTSEGYEYGFFPTDAPARANLRNNIISPYCMACGKPYDISFVKIVLRLWNNVFPRP